jgi:hypothetical protein
MSLRKNRPKCSPSHFCQNLNLEIDLWKKVTQNIFKKLPKENKSPIGENSPNLVTLCLSLKE